MGVKGLWSLLNPVARPVQIESMEGKRLAIDSSIWLYQFQATMRDKDGRVLVNAHVLGFLRRINKLLFHGIKPVFVFDGGAPALKRSTIAERKRKKQGAAINHAKTAEKLFAAQMRREAVKAAQAQRDAQAARDAQNAAAAAARYDEEAGDMIDENAVYLEDLERTGNAPPRPQHVASDSGTYSSAPRPAAVQVEEPPDPREERRKKFKKHDPYRLPAAGMPTVSTEEKPDARLATEAELQQFIDEMRPTDIDIESAEFRALPTEVQYEIIGDMRIRSRQQSHKRLSDMLRKAPTAMDFSMAQIKGLSQRNVLTQQLLTVTDMVGQAHLTIPVRIAAERNREYVLLKRGEDVGGGWALGIREGSKQKPIEVDKEEESDRKSSSSSSEDEDSDDDFEEIKPPIPKIDPDIAAERRRQILDAISARYAPANPRPSRPSRIVPVTSFGAAHAPSQPDLFAKDEDLDDVQMVDAEEEVVPTANDEALALALQQEELGSDEDEADPDLARALAMSRAERTSGPVRDLAADGAAPTMSRHSSEQETVEMEEGYEDSDDSMEEVSLVPSGRSTPAVFEASTEEEADDDDEFEEVETPPLPIPRSEATSASKTSNSEQMDMQSMNLTTTDGLAQGFDDSAMTVSLDAEEAGDQPKDKEREEPVMEVSGTGIAGTTLPTALPPISGDTDTAQPSRPSLVAEPEVIVIKDEDEEGIVPIAPPAPAASVASDPKRGTDVGKTALAKSAAPRAVAPGPSVRSRPSIAPHRSSSLLNKPNIPSSLSRSPSISVGQRQEATPASRRSTSTSVPPPRLERDAPSPPSPVLPLSLVEHEPDRMIDEALASGMKSRTASFAMSNPEKRESEAEEDDGDSDGDDDRDYEDDSRSIAWSRSPSPHSHRSRASTSAPSRPPLQPNESMQSVDSTGSAEAPDFGDEGEDVDMNANDMVEEQDDYARFLANIKNRDLNEVRTEIDDEIRILNGQNKVAMRDSDEITLAMIAQIQTLLRHFGIPYITAPMEAEAQCAKLAELGLVDGIITDDSDVFLFGGVQCFKNIFNDSKYAECFLSSDLTRELSLSRERLISLAYLLGSDYTIGLPGVGPVVALELLANFPGPNGIDDFKEWWTKVQRGQDGGVTDTKWKQSFKKRYSKLLFLTADWPNPLVREAYLYPTTDESEEPFHWGFPKLSALRSFLHEELSWSISKVDDELTPIVQRIARRGKDGAMNKQSTLTSFFDTSAGALANYAPRKKTTANVSKRLLSIIKQFREAEARVAGTQIEGLGEMLAGVDKDDPKGRMPVKRADSEMLLPVDASVDDLELDGADTDSKAVKKRAPRVPRAPRRKKSDASIAETVDTEYTETSETAPKKRAKTGPRKRKAPASNATIEGEVREDDPNVDADFTAAAGTKVRSTASRNKKRAVAGAPGSATRGEGVDDTMGDNEVPSFMADDISQVPPEDRGKWRRQQQKKWRRAAVAGSVRPDP